MKANGNKGTRREKANSSIPMVTFMKGCIQTISAKATEFTRPKRGLSMRAIGKMISSKAKAQRSGLGAKGIRGYMIKV